MMKKLLKHNSIEICSNILLLFSLFDKMYIVIDLISIASVKSCRYLRHSHQYDVKLELLVQVVIDLLTRNS